jgi:hypothetical protein
VRTVAAARNQSSDLHSLVWERSHKRTQKQTQTKASETATETTIRPRLSSSVITNGAGTTPAAMVREGESRGITNNHAQAGYSHQMKCQFCMHARAPVPAEASLHMQRATPTEPWLRWLRDQGYRCGPFFPQVRQCTRRRKRQASIRPQGLFGGVGPMVCNEMSPPFTRALRASASSETGWKRAWR